MNEVIGNPNVNLGAGSSCVVTEHRGIYVFGELLFDIFPSGAKKLGGAPCNVAWHLKGFELNPHLISAVGRDNDGDEAIELLHRWGFNIDHIARFDQYSTGKVEVKITDGEPHYDIVSPVAYDNILAPQIDVKDDEMKIRLLYHGTLAIRNESSRHSLDEMIETARRLTAKRFMDVNLRDPWYSIEKVQQLMISCHTVKMNIDELRMLTEVRSTPDSMTWHADLEKVRQDYSMTNLLITLGEQGVCLVDEHGDLHQVEPPQLNAPVVDTVGAGDAFSSVVIVGLCNSWDWNVTLERAQQFASFIVTQEGALCHSKKTYRDFCNLWNLC